MDSTGHTIFKASIECVACQTNVNVSLRENYLKQLRWHRCLMIQVKGAIRIDFISEVRRERRDVRMGKTNCLKNFGNNWSDVILLQMITSKLLRKEYFDKTLFTCFHLLTLFSRKNYYPSKDYFAFQVAPFDVL